ncbi:hypothetical protein SK128_022423 [Halocaridina rubra]|uniref:Uncharacterized protein n=1 Tax=Halocaridina rubra TaxID=373956 RepID=A0AAN8WQ80_HALRR
MDEEICKNLNKELQSVFTAEIGAHGPVLRNNIFSVTEVCKALMELDAHKATGLDDISPYKERKRGLE